MCLSWLWRLQARGFPLAWQSTFIIFMKANWRNRPKSFCRAWFFWGCSGTHEKLIKTGTLRKLGKWAPKLSRPTHPAVSVVFFLLPEPCRAKQAKQGVLGWVEANPVISGGWITQNCWKNMFYYWKYWKWPSSYRFHLRFQSCSMAQRSLHQRRRFHLDSILGSTVCPKLGSFYPIFGSFN